MAYNNDSAAQGNALLQNIHSDFDSLVPDRQARAELGDVSVMAFWRWDQNPSKAPPGWEPPTRIGNRKFRTRSMLERVKALGKAGA